MSELTTDTAKLVAKCFDRFEHYLGGIEDIIKTYHGLVTDRDAILERFNQQRDRDPDPVAAGEMIDEIFATAAKMNEIEINFTDLVTNFTEQFQEASLKDAIDRLGRFIDNPQSPKELQTLCSDARAKLMATEVRMLAVIAMVLEGLVSHREQNNLVVAKATTILNKLRSDIVIH